MSSQIIKVNQARIENIGALPTVPGTLKLISSVIANPMLTLDEISRFVSNDPALTAKVLKMVNSAAFGFPGRISSVSHAIMLLGLNVVRGLLLGISVFEIMEKVMAGLWGHSLACASAARTIALQRGLANPEEISVAGLLHDMGKVLLILEYPKQYEEVMNKANSAGVTVIEMESEYFSDPHPSVGKWLGAKWNFPRNLLEVIAFHHSPEKAKLAPMEAAIVHLSDILVRARGIGFAGDPFVPAVNPAAFEKINPSAEEIKMVLERIETTLESEG